MYILVMLIMIFCSGCASCGRVSRLDKGIEWKSDRPALIEYSKEGNKETLKVDSRGQPLINIGDLPIEVDK